MTVSFVEAIKLAYKRALDFEGRSSRAEFWPYFLFYAVTAALLGTLFDDDIGAAMGLVSGLIVMVNFVVLLSSAVRRLHDTDKSGWWLLLGVIPVIGTLVLIIFYARKGDAYDNRYGPSPLSSGFTVEVID